MGKTVRNHFQMHYTSKVTEMVTLSEILLTLDYAKMLLFPTKPKKDRRVQLGKGKSLHIPSRNCSVQNLALFDLVKSTDKNKNLLTLPFMVSSHSCGISMLNPNILELIQNSHIPAVSL